MSSDVVAMHLLHWHKLLGFVLSRSITQTGVPLDVAGSIAGESYDVKLIEFEALRGILVGLWKQNRDVIRGSANTVRFQVQHDLYCNARRCQLCIDCLSGDDYRQAVIDGKVITGQLYVLDFLRSADHAPLILSGISVSTRTYIAHAVSENPRVSDSYRPAESVSGWL